MVALGTQSAMNSHLCDLLVSAPAQAGVADRGAYRRMHRLSEGQAQQLVEERAAGAEIKELAERYGVDRSTVINHLRRAGVPGRRRQGRRLSPDQVTAAGKLYASGLALVDVGVQFDVDRRYLRKALLAAGFPLRPPGRQKGQPE
jgi:hypothetical protein